MTRPLFRVAVLCLAAAPLSCGRSVPVKGVGPPEVTARASADAGVASACAGQLPPSCCEQAQRVTSADCSAGGTWTCARGKLCECNGVPANAVCVDFCGTDAYSDAICGAAGWECPGGLALSTTCPAGTCFGEPGDCCVNPSCEAGQWKCQSVRDPCY